jgi:aryl-alcohol dehydrogenase-like predicted oxidoreductase
MVRPAGSEYAPDACVDKHGGQQVRAPLTGRNLVSNWAASVAAAAVGCRARVDRFRRLMPSSASSLRIGWLNAETVTPNSLPAFAILSPAGDRQEYVQVGQRGSIENPHPSSVMAPLSQAQRTSSGEPHSNNHAQARLKLEIIMDYVSLGRSGMKVSRYVLGTLTFAGTNGFEALGDVNVANARRMIDTARDAGINAFDTANLYSKGDAETVLGEAIKGRRGELLLFSKGRSAMGDGPNDGGASRVHLTAQLEGSLQRLQTDHLDLYFVHQWDGVTPPEETVETMSSFVKAGKIRYWGISNYSGWSLAKTVMIAREPGFVPPVAHQIYYTPEAREAEYELMPAADEFGIGSMIWSPLGQGLFSGKVAADGTAPAGTRQERRVGGSRRVRLGPLRARTGGRPASRCGNWPLRSAGDAGLVARPARRQLPRAGSPHGRTTRRQSCLGGSDAQPTPGGPDRGRRATAPAIPLLAPRHVGNGPAEPGRAALPGRPPPDGRHVTTQNEGRCP